MSEDEVRAFTEGDCWLLAQHVRRLTGLPLVFANPWPKDEGYWEHVGVLVAQDRVLDVEGIHPRSEWVRKWAPLGGTSFEAHTDEEIADHLDADRMFPWVSPARAARELVARFGLAS